MANAEAIFSVHSFGPVIPMADRERIFDRYYRSSTYANRAAGTGIGLSVAKRVAHDSRRLRLGDQRRAGGDHVLRRHSSSGTRRGDPE